MVCFAFHEERECPSGRTSTHRYGETRPYTKSRASHFVLIIVNRGHDDPLLIAGSYVNSPRRNQVADVGAKIMDAATGALLLCVSLCLFAHAPSE